jgi:hypothetical protein
VDGAMLAQELFEGGATLEDVVRELRAAGFSKVESVNALAKTGMSLADIQLAVLESPIWADRGIVAFEQWIDPPDLPDVDTVDRLRMACHAESRIVGAWFTGTRFTRADGSSFERTDLALLLDPPLGENWEVESGALAAIVDRLGHAAPPAGGKRNYGPVTREILDANAGH